MNKDTYSLLENYMISCAEDSAHDKEHIYRVLYNAMRIAKTEENVDFDILITACLLHDVGRKEQFADPTLCHAMVGGDKAYAFLVEHGFGMSFAETVRKCIQTHRFRQNNQPESLEAKILFDADKLDVSGALGIARTLLDQGNMSEPLYVVWPDGSISNGENDDRPSFFQDYKYKLEKMYEKFFTAEGKRLACGRQKAAAAFYNDLYREVQESYEGKDLLGDLLA